MLHSEIHTVLKASAADPKSEIGNGASEGTRTPDRLITNQLLYQLSYAGP